MIRFFVRIAIADYAVLTPINMQINTHTDTHTDTYIYMYECVYIYLDISHRVREQNRKIVRQFQRRMKCSDSGSALINHSTIRFHEESII